MATTKMSLTLESTAAFLAEQAARRDGLSVFAWLSKFIHQHYPPKPYDGEALAVAGLEHQNAIAERASGWGRRAAGCVLALPAARDPLGLMVLISAQYLIEDPAVTMLYGLPVVPDDPGGLTAILVMIGGTAGWLTIARDITRVYPGALTEFLGALDPADLDRVDKASYNTFGLPL